MRPALHLAIFGPALIAGPAALGGEVLKPTIDVNDMRVVVSYVSTGELENLQRKYGARIDPREIRQDYRHGFSILKMNRETGARTC